MIPLEILHGIKTIITHDKCPDGTASALLLRDVLPDANVIFCQYSTPAHEALVAEPGIIFADFSPHRDHIQKFVDAGAVVLDHHRTAKEVVAAFGPLGVFGDEVGDPGVSGAVLAYREVWKPLREELRALKGSTIISDGYDEWVENFARIAGIRDTWQKKSPDWEKACVQSSALFFMPQQEIVQMGLREVWKNWDVQLGWAGQIHYTKHCRTVEKVVKDSFRYTTVKGTRIALFQGVKLSSDAAEVPGVDVDIICGFEVIYEDNAPRYIYSCRSRTNYDVSALAKFYDGGGHRAAAGFNIKKPLNDPYTQFISALEHYETTNGSSQT